MGKKTEGSFMLDKHRPAIIWTFNVVPHAGQRWGIRHLTTCRSGVHSRSLRTTGKWQEKGRRGLAVMLVTAVLY